VAREGELVQLDGSPHDWLAGRVETPLGRAPGSLVQRTPPRRREHILRGRGFQQKAVGKIQTLV